MGAWLRRKKASRKRKQAYRDRLQEEKDAAWFTAKEAKLSKKQAKKLNKIYGDLNPDDINAINQVQPYVADMNRQLEDNGIPVEDSNDPIEVTTKYNTEILGEDAPESYEPAFSEGYESYDKEKAKTALKTVFGAIAGAFTARKREADTKAAKGQQLSEADKAIMNVNETKNSLVNDYKRDEFSKTLKKLALPALLLTLLYFAFK